MKVDLEKCIGCGYCVRDCPLEAVRYEKKAVIGEKCTDCGACMKVCEQGALEREDEFSRRNRRVRCLPHYLSDKGRRDRGLSPLQK